MSLLHLSSTRMTLVQQSAQTPCCIQEVYRILRQNPWSPELQPVIVQFEQKIRSKVLDLVCKAYSSICVEKAAALVGVSREELIRGETTQIHSIHLQGFSPLQLTCILQKLKALAGTLTKRQMS